MDKVSLTKRNEVVAFMGVKGEGDAVVYHRMRGFTEISTSLNPVEYSRRYVDEESERTDVTGYNRSLTYAFDEFSDSAVHQSLIDIEDNEKTGTAAVVEIVMVYLNKESSTEGSYVAHKRNFTVVPDTSGGEVEAMTHSGTLKANGSMVVGTATTEDEWQTAKFSEAVA